MRRDLVAMLGALILAGAPGGTAFAQAGSAQAGAGKPGAQQNGDVFNRLMKEPLTLFDWGLAQLDRDMARAVTRLRPGAVRANAARHGSIYDWRKRRITLYLSLTTPEQVRTRKTCRNLFVDVVNELVAGAPAGSDAAGWYLLNAFKPKAHFWGRRFEDTGAQLARLVSLEVSLLPAEYAAAAGDSRRVSCSGRLDATPESLEYGTS